MTRTSLDTPVHGVRWVYDGEWVLKSRQTWVYLRDVPALMGCLPRAEWPAPIALPYEGSMGYGWFAATRDGGIGYCDRERLHPRGGTFIVETKVAGGLWHAAQRATEPPPERLENAATCAANAGLRGATWRSDDGNTWTLHAAPNDPDGPVLLSLVFEPADYQRLASTYPGALHHLSPLDICPRPQSQQHLRQMLAGVRHAPR